MAPPEAAAAAAANQAVGAPVPEGELALQNVGAIERPAAQCRYKYQLRLTEARKLLGGR